MLPGDGWIDAVADAVREVADTVVAPRFARLAAADVGEKHAGEVVTVVDEEAEAALTARLHRIAPGVPVVAEEAAGRDAGLLGALAREPLVWLVDPLDGTANFVAGSPDHAVMVALVASGATVASWMWRPADAAMFVAVAGAGARRDGRPLTRPPTPDPAPGALHGEVLPRFLDAGTAAAVERNRHRFASIGSGSRCAAVDYPRVATGERDFVLFWRTLPWDHAPGALLATEAGCRAWRLDATPYRPDQDGVGLLVAGAEVWDTARHALLGPHRPEPDRGAAAAPGGAQRSGADRDGGVEQPATGRRDDPGRWGCCERS